MPDFSLLGGGNRFEQAGADTSVSSGKSISASASADTKGSYTELIASTAFDASMVFVTITFAASADRSLLIDFAVGAAASEQVIIPDVYFTFRAGTTGFNAMFPIRVPAGSRLSARSQASTGSTLIFVQMFLVGAPMLMGGSLGRVTAYGADTANSKGTAIDAGGSANTKGAYAELTASTANPIKYMGIALGPNENFARSNDEFLFDVAVGAAASEQVVLPNLFAESGNTADQIMPMFLGPVPVNIPAGTRLSMRSQSNSIDASNRVTDAVIYGID